MQKNQRKTTVSFLQQSK